MKRSYLCFLLRIWQVGDQDSGVRALLEEPGSRNLIGFASVQDLCAYLETISSDLEEATSAEEDHSPMILPSSRFRRRPSNSP
ncbi:MAG: hypothetical protein P8129_06035 [Anaerolineae bacterium]